MSDFTDAQREMREAADEATGRTNTVRINGKTFPAIVKDATFEEIEVNGGKAESGGFRALVSVVNCPKKPPQGATVEARGHKELSVLSVENPNGDLWIIVAGDPSTE